MQIQLLSTDELHKLYDERDAKHREAVARYLEIKKQLDEADREMNFAENSLDTVGRQLEIRHREEWRARQ